MNSIALPKIPLFPSFSAQNPNPNRSLKTLQPKPYNFSSLSSLRSHRRLASISSGGGVGGDDFSGGGGGGGGGGGEGGGETESRSIAVGDLNEVLDLGSDDDVIILSVGGMSCGGCAASVKRILESQPQVSSANVNFEKETAVIWVIPEVKVALNWQQELGDKLANHLTTCGFKSNLQGGA